MTYIYKLEGITVAVITQQALHSLLKKGIEKANNETGPVLVSQSVEVPPIDPLVFFANNKSKFKGKRYFWTNPSKDLTMIGLGCAWEVTAKDHAFQTIEDHWQKLLENMILDSENGIGPRLIGGFSFDPKQTQTKTWVNFPATAFTLPKWLLTIENNKTWLTINILVDRESEIEKLANQLMEEKVGLFVKNNLSPGQLNLIYEEIAPNKWMHTVDKMAKAVREGFLDKIVLARQLRVEAHVGKMSVEQILINLSAQQRFSYIFAFERGDDCFLGASPERLINKEGNTLFSTCLAGTTGRGDTPEEDAKLGNALLHDKKNLEEHQFVVSMIQAALESVCDEVLIPDTPSLYKVRNVQHLYTPVKGYTNSDTSILSMVKKLHPTPALGGYPQKKAIEVIREEENMDRGWYSAPIGWVDYNGDGEFAVGIRSGLISEKRAVLYAGCGIVGDSNPISEYKETKMKFQPMLTALGGKEIE